MEMENGNEMSSSSLSFDSYLSNGSSNNDNNVPPAPVPSSIAVAAAAPELLGLSELSKSLGKLVDRPDDYNDYADAEIEVEGKVIGVHRCILAARSPFLDQHFKAERKEGAGKPRYLMSELVGAGGMVVGYEAFMIVLNYLYTGKVQPSKPDVSTCVDASCAHVACGPAIQYAVEIMYISATFQITELVMLFERQLLNYVDNAFAEDVIPILMVAFYSDSKQLLSHCIQRIARSDLHLITIDKELPLEVAIKIKSLRVEQQQQQEEEEHNSALVADSKRIRSIHRALDSDDIELVRLLMEESKLSLDAAYALHYAAAYCTGKILKELLNMRTADVNLKDSRGHTVLHVAARRKDSSVIVELLHWGASVSLTTGDGRTALTICRRLTRLKDFKAEVKHGEEANKDRLCIDMLEREMGRKSLDETISMSGMTAADDLHMNLLLYENRVAMARSLFPHQARLAMQIAEADMTLEFAGLSASKGKYGNFREVKLNEIPSEQVEKLQHQRLQALQKTVETGRRFFPSCSAVLDKLLEDDTLGTLLLERGTLEERKKKRMRYMELKDEVMKAFNKDMEKNGLAHISSSQPSSSAKHRVRKR